MQTPEEYSGARAAISILEKNEAGQSLKPLLRGFPREQYVEHAPQKFDSFMVEDGKIDLSTIYPDMSSAVMAYEKYHRQNHGPLTVSIVPVEGGYTLIQSQ